MSVVIGIIMLLMAMAVIGYRYLEAKASGDRTRVFLHDAAGMVSELDRLGQYWRLESTSQSGANGAFATGATLNASQLGDVSPAGGGRGQANNYCLKIVPILLQVEANQTAYSRLPGKALVAGSGTPAAFADGWSNPIIWVPSGGLTGVKLGSKADSSGNVSYNNTVTITSPDGRGFWASAGPDGDFSTGDDNLYSFEK